MLVLSSTVYSPGALAQEKYPQWRWVFLVKCSYYLLSTSQGTLWKKVWKEPKNIQDREKSCKMLSLEHGIANAVIGHMWLQLPAMDLWLAPAKHQPEREPKWLLNSRGGAGKPKSQSWTWFYSVGLKTRHIDRKVGNVLPGRGESEKGHENEGKTALYTVCKTVKEQILYMLF